MLLRPTTKPTLLKPKPGLPATLAGAMGPSLPANMRVETTKFKFSSTAELAGALEHHRQLLSTMKPCAHPPPSEAHPRGPPVYQPGYIRW